MAAEKPQVMGSVPVPDPTTLTTEALTREIDGLREQTEKDIGNMRALIETRLDGNDQAVELLRTTTDKVPGMVADAIGQLEKLHNEKFNSIQVQFAERDTRTEQLSSTSKLAVDAALQAAKELGSKQNEAAAAAIAKSEAATTKQIDQIGTLIGANTKAADEKIDDLKTRVQAIESRKQGGTDAWAVIMGVAGLLVAFAAVVIVLLKR